MLKDKKTTSQLLDQEKIYSLLLREDWKSLLGFVWTNSNLIASDEILKNAVNTCEQFFFANLEKEKEDESFINNLATFYALHQDNKHLLSENNFKITVLQLVELWENRSLETAKNYALHFPNEEICERVIKAHKATLPKFISHSQNEQIQVVQNKNVSEYDGRRTLFKSNQEREFFYAVRDCFPHFIVYPNVALSSIIDFDSIKDRLTQAEKDYYFRAIIDCVVFDDKDKLLLPVYFFELDSSFHDSQKQKEKDEMKDKILATAGQELYRVRRISDKQDRDDFTQLIKDLTKK